MSSIQVADQTFVAVPAADIASLVAEPANQRRWFADLRLAVAQDRGPQGVRWTVSGPLHGTMEVWLEPVMDGTIVHYFLHCEPTAAGVDLPRENHRRRVAGRAMTFELKDRLDSLRRAGERPAHARMSGEASAAQAEEGED